MSPTVVIAGLAAAGAVWMIAYQVIGPRRGIVRQIAPYTASARSRHGLAVTSLPEPVISGESFRRVLGPLGEVVSGRLSRLLGLGNSQALELTLRQAGNRKNGLPWTVEEYRRQHLKWAVLFPIISTITGLVMGSTTMIVLFLAGGLLVGARHMPEKLKRETKRRSERMRSDVPTVAWMIAPRVRSAMSLPQAVAAIVEQGNGPVIDDLARALGLVARGRSESDAYKEIANDSVEPVAARLYSLLSVAATGNIDLAAALRELARQTRTQRREEVVRAAAKNEITMVVPDLVFMAPVLIVFLLAPVPRLLFGGH